MRRLLKPLRWLVVPVLALVLYFSASLSPATPTANAQWYGGYGYGSAGYSYSYYGFYGYSMYGYGSNYFYRPSYWGAYYYGY